MKISTKSFIVLLAGIAALACLQPSTVFATQYTVRTVGGYGPYQTGVGGEFTFFSQDLANVIANYCAGAQDQYNVTGDKPNFQTFCVEGQEFVYPNTRFNVVLNNQSVSTGVFLTSGAAWLYSQFASGASFADASDAIAYFLVYLALAFTGPGKFSIDGAN